MTEGLPVTVVEDARHRPPLWLLYLATAAAGVAAFFAAPLAGAARGGVQTTIEAAINASAVIALLVGPRLHACTHRLPWTLLAVAQALTTVGDLIFSVGFDATDGWAVSPNVTDALYLANYPVVAAALVLLIRRRTPGWDAASFIDASIVAVSAALLFWVYLVSPLAGGSGLTAAGRVVTAGYPVGDLLLLVVAMRLVLGVGARTASFRFLCGYLVLLPGADLVFAVQSLWIEYESGTVLDAGWMLGVASLGAAALHPSMARVSERSAVKSPDATAGRLLLLTVASLLAPATLLVQDLTGGDLHVRLVVGACVALFSLVMVRMAALVRTQRHAAITDGLTGLRTRRFFEEALIREVERSRRGGHAFAVLLLDIDHFKRVNDAHGHHGGDRVLCEVAARLTALLRTGDLTARYGGEEFALLLPDTGPDAARDVAERVLRGIGSLPMAVGERNLAEVTVSVGVACLPAHCADGAELTQLADRALYTAKAAGRNRVVSAVPLRQGAVPSG
ncbi:MAG: GGDEF domain-containing protein [Kineosporiaceae bacterium]